MVSVQITRCHQAKPGSDLIDRGFPKRPFPSAKKYPYYAAAALTLVAGCNVQVSVAVEIRHGDHSSVRAQPVGGLELKFPVPLSQINC
jgi:hypothetical protein